jgi:hypothetical protein
VASATACKAWLSLRGSGVPRNTTTPASASAAPLAASPRSMPCDRCSFTKRSRKRYVAHASTIAATTIAMRTCSEGSPPATMRAYESSGQCHRYSG